MKTWTVVVEVKVEERIRAGQEAFDSFTIYETIDAPYGPAGVTVKVKE